MQRTEQSAAYSSRTAAVHSGKQACQDAQTLDGATGMSTQTYTPGARIPVRIAEVQRTEQSAAYTFGEAPPTGDMRVE